MVLKVMFSKQLPSKEELEVLRNAYMYLSVLPCDAQTLFFLILLLQELHLHCTRIYWYLAQQRTAS